MKKIVINSSYGGFAISALGCAMLHQLGFPMTEVDESFYSDRVSLKKLKLKGYQGDDEFGIIKFEGALLAPDFGEDRDTMRSHPILVKVVELLGPAVNVRYSKLNIVELADETPYLIRDYDGAESVVPLNLSDYTDGYIATDIKVPEELEKLAESEKTQAAEQSKKPKK